MTKTRIIIVSLLLIGASIMIHFLLKDSNTKLDKDFVEFFSGMLFGVGFSVLVSEIFRRKKRMNN